MTTVVSSKDESLKPARASKRRAKQTDSPTEDEIRILAYSLYEKRREEGTAGDATADWLEARRQLAESQPS